MEKLVCIKNKETGEVLRVSESYASKKVTTTEWNYTSKSVYKKYSKEVEKPKYSAGTFGSSMKVSTKGKPFNGNNRKTTKGRKVYYQEINGKEIKIPHVSKNGKHTWLKRVFVQATRTLTKSFGFDIHAAAIHLSAPDPILGGFTSSKQGKAAVISEHIVWPKGDKIPLKSRRRKHYVLPSSLLRNSSTSEKN